jgi:hypothetical protein
VWRVRAGGQARSGKEARPREAVARDGRFHVFVKLVAVTINRLADVEAARDGRRRFNVFLKLVAATINRLADQPDGFHVFLKLIAATINRLTDM